MKSRKFYRDILNHCYQRTADGGVLFYSVSDHLVHFTTYCVLARKYKIRVYALCHMPDHLHDSVSAKRKADLEGFKQELNSYFSREYNKAYGLRGARFESPFGSAPKNSDKAARTNLVYVGNNPVERQLVERAEEYQWNFLAYARSAHPFSQKLVIREARWPMQCAVKEVKAAFNAGKAVNYAMLKRIVKPLDKNERAQLTDYIIGLYNVIDYMAAARFFNGYDNFLEAMHASTGSEHDLNEVFIGKSDAHYVRMSNVLLQSGSVKETHEFLSLSVDQKLELFDLLRRQTSAMGEQIAKFLHLPLKKL